MNEVSKKQIIILLVIISIIAVIIILVSVFDTKDNNKVSGVNPYTNEAYISEKEMQQKIQDTDIYENLNIVVNNLYDFVKVYRGDVTTKSYTEYIKNLNSEFKNLHYEISNLSSAEQDKYFEKNKDIIKRKYGIEKVTIFDDLIDYISIYDNEGLTYKDVTLEKDSVEDGTEYVKTKVKITYSNDVIKTLFISVIKDTSSNNPQFVISF